MINYEELINAINNQPTSDENEEQNNLMIESQNNQDQNFDNNIENSQESLDNLFGEDEDMIIDEENYEDYTIDREDEDDEGDSVNQQPCFSEPNQQDDTQILEQAKPNQFIQSQAGIIDFKPGLIQFENSKSEKQGGKFTQRKLMKAINVNAYQEGIKRFVSRYLPPQKSKSDEIFEKSQLKRLILQFEYNCQSVQHQYIKDDKIASDISKQRYSRQCPIKDCQKYIQVQEKYISSFEFPNSQFNENNSLGYYNLFSKKNAEYLKEEPVPLVIGMDTLTNLQKLKTQRQNMQNFRKNISLTRKQQPDKSNQTEVSPDRANELSQSLPMYLKQTESIKMKVIKRQKNYSVSYNQSLPPQPLATNIMIAEFEQDNKDFKEYQNSNHQNSNHKYNASSSSHGHNLFPIRDSNQHQIIQDYHLHKKMNHKKYKNQSNLNENSFNQDQPNRVLLSQIDHQLPQNELDTDQAIEELQEFSLEQHIQRQKAESLRFLQDLNRIKISNQDLKTIQKQQSPYENQRKHNMQLSQRSLGLGVGEILPSVQHLAQSICPQEEQDPRDTQMMMMIQQQILSEATSRERSTFVFNQGILSFCENTYQNQQIGGGDASISEQQQYQHFQQHQQCQLQQQQLNFERTQLVNIKKLISKLPGVSGKWANQTKLEAVNQIIRRSLINRKLSSKFYNLKGQNEGEGCGTLSRNILIDESRGGISRKACSLDYYGAQAHKGLSTQQPPLCANLSTHESALKSQPHQLLIPASLRLEINQKQSSPSADKENQHIEREQHRKNGHFGSKLDIIGCQASIKRKRQKRTQYNQHQYQQQQHLAEPLKFEQNEKLSAQSLEQQLALIKSELNARASLKLASKSKQEPDRQISRDVDLRGVQGFLEKSVESLQI
ncbi:UNKNOWN [Stylonychia lemnae]|uniref:Uncharacterized protein n=1 Tax=Stylonychia lemnae TaxID=5949 RepID=A0A078A170_STYLE|nr:UNKNOWN [Stylonychia lemnae]|eukprot:CDW75233.1 UNKNOWN [Stylonychia lemnae]